MAKKRLIKFILLYLLTNMATTIGYMAIEAWSFIDSLFHTIINVVAFGGVGLPFELITLVDIERPCFKAAEPTTDPIDGLDMGIFFQYRV